MKATFFKSPLDFRKWLEKNHLNASELIVGYYKVGSGKPSLSWSESVDQALCFGWIDGVRRGINEDSYCIRFTPRRANSIWSDINLKKVEALQKAGLMMPEGMRLFDLRKAHQTKLYSHEKPLSELDPAYEKLFKKNKKAWTFFDAQAASYKKVMLHWIMGAKQEKTRLARLEKTILASEQQKRME